MSSYDVPSYFTICFNKFNTCLTVGQLLRCTVEYCAREAYIDVKIRRDGEARGPLLKVSSQLVSKSFVFHLKNYLPKSQQLWFRLLGCCKDSNPVRFKSAFFSGFIFTAAQVVYITAMINRVFISFPAVQINGLSYIHLHSIFSFVLYARLFTGLKRGRSRHKIESPTITYNLHTTLFSSFSVVVISRYCRLLLQCVVHLTFINCREL